VQRVRFPARRGRGLVLRVTGSRKGMEWEHGHKRDGTGQASEASSSKQEEEATLPVRDAGESGGSLGPPPEALHCPECLPVRRPKCFFPEVPASQLPVAGRSSERPPDWGRRASSQRASSAGYSTVCLQLPVLPCGHCCRAGAGRRQGKAKFRGTGPGSCQQRARIGPR
jgi:hypothetical protein